MNRKPWFYRLLMSYLPVFLAVACLMVLLSFIALKESSEQAAAKANEAFLTYIVQVVDQQLMQIDQLLIKEISHDPAIQNFYYRAPDANAYLTDYEASRKVKNLIDVSDLIHSVYFYRASDHVVLSAEAKVPIEQSEEEEFIRDMSARPDAYHWTRERPYYNFGSAPVQVVSLVRKVPLLSGEKGIVVVNLSTYGLRRMLVDTFALKDDQFLHIFDAGGKGLVEWNGRGEVEPERFHPANRIFTSITSAYSGWSYFSGLHNGAFAWVASSVLYGGAIAALLLIGTLWIVYMTRRNYKPIEEIMTRVSAYTKEKTAVLGGKGRNDEFYFIGDALGRLIEQSNEFEEQREENFLYKSKQFFAGLLKGEYSFDTDGWNELSAWIRMPDRVDHAVVMVMEIDKYPEFCSEYTKRDQLLLKFVLSSVLAEIGTQHASTVWSDWVAPHQLAALCIVEKVKEPSQGSYAMGEHLATWVEENLKYTVTVGVGTDVTRVRDVSRSFEEALEALKYKSSLGNNQVICIWDVSAVSQGQMFKHLQMIHALTQSFRLDDPGWRHQLDSLFEEMEKETLSREEIASLLNYLMYQVYREFTFFPGEFQAFWTTRTMPALQDIVNGFETIEDLHRAFRRLFGEVSDKLLSYKNGRKNHELLQDIRDYIGENYANSDLSLTHLSEAFDMNAKYISQLFKEEFGEKFIDYVTRVRIQHAAVMLEQSADSIQAVGERVGYVHSFSFIRAFKKIMGTTPGDYRKAMRS